MVHSIKKNIRWRHNCNVNLSTFFDYRISFAENGLYCVFITDLFCTVSFHYSFFLLEIYAGSVVSYSWNMDLNKRKMPHHSKRVFLNLQFKDLIFKKVWCQFNNRMSTGWKQYQKQCDIYFHFVNFNEI